ncbi:MAG: peptidoglycan DD-metalloendopeptidase family protein [Candidatus Pacebacteria bacterium]|nr:peptidoglycan DD-metalloendopeptidase family protein [Candidatus Paceibacterota bacterium]
MIGTLAPIDTAYASVFSGVLKKADAQTEGVSSTSPVSNSQTTPAVLTSNFGPSMLGAESKKIAIANVVISNDEVALTPSMGPAGNAVEAADTEEAIGAITFYTVQPGDTISSVAKMFGITELTLKSANNLKTGEKLKVDETLVILPHSGIQHTVKKGETLGSLEKKYKVTKAEIMFYNDLTAESKLVVGEVLMIPDATFDGTSDAIPTKKPTTKPSTGTKTPVNNSPITVHPARLTSKIDLGTAILRPVSINASRRSQGIHGFNGVDIAAKKGTPIVAPYDGTVLYLRESGYNEGYGMYVILQSNIDGNRVQFIMAHMSEINVAIGETVSRGQKIGEVGNTGNSSGSHLHFEVRGAKNPLGTNAYYTGE